MTLTTFSDTTNVGEDFIQHYGTKGMKWGVRKDLKKLPTKKAREAYVAEKDAKWRAKTEDPKKAIRAAKRASRDATRMTRKLNKKYKDMGYKLKGNSLRKNNINNRKNRLVRNQYDIELKGIIESSLDSAAYRVYKNSPSRLYQVNLSRDLDGTVSAKITPRQNAKLDKQRASITNKARKMKHSDEGTQDLYVKMEEDEDGFVVDIQLPEFDLEFAEDEVALDHSDLSDLGSGFIQHYGVKGMKWGKRKAEDEVKTTASKSKYGTSTTNADGTTEMYVGGVGTVGKHLTEEEQAEVDELAKVVQELGDKSNAMVPELNELEMEESKLKQTAKTPEEKKRLSEVTTKREALSDKLSAIMDEYSPKALRYNELAAKANKADAEYYKTHPDERRKANIKPKFGTTTYTIQKPKPAGPDEARFKKKIKHSNSQNGIYSSDLSELGSGFIQHYGVKGMKWGVRKNKHGKVTSVVKRTPFRGSDESGSSGAVQSIRKQNDPQLEASLKRVKQTYKTSTQSINQGLRNINKLYEGVDLNTAPKKVKDEYYKEVNSNINEKLTANTILNSRPKDRLIPLFDYDVKKGGPPEVSFASNHGFSSGAARASATRVRDADMNTLDHGKRIAKRITKRMAIVYVTGGLIRSGVEFGEGVNAGLDDYERMRHDGMGDVKLPRLDVAFDIDVDEFGKVTNVKFEVLTKDVSHSDLSDLGSDFLMHHGVKGMKWGVRKDSKPRGYQGSSSTKKKVKKAVSDAVDPDKRAKRKLQKAKSKYERQRLIEQASGYEKAAEESKKNSRENEASSDPKPKSKSVKDLSDDDLNKIIRRIELEKRYSTLMEQQRPKSTTEKVNKFLKKAATEAAENAAKQLITKGIGAAVTRATGVPVNGANAKAATNALKTAANDAAKDVTETAQKQAAAQPKTPSAPTPKASTPTKSPTKSPIKSPSFSDILSKSYNDTITSGTTQRGNSWLDEFDTNRDFVTLNVERRKRR